MPANPIIQEMRFDDIRHDPFGTALSWHFAIADALTGYGPPYAPPRWGYRPAAGGPDTDAPEYETVCDLLDSGAATPAELIRAGDICARLVRLCRLAGRDY